MIFNQTADDRKVRSFTLQPSFVENYQDKQPAWGPIGYFTFKRTYARATENGGTEEFWQTVQRVVEGCFNIQKIHCKQMGLPWKEDKAQGSAQDMFERIWAFKFTPPGRGLWMMGTDLVYERGSGALQNCAFVSTENIAEDFSAPFTFLMDMSMLGVGVGGDCRGAGKVKINTPRTTDEPFVVEDSREGWAEILKVVLNSFVGKGHFPLLIDYSKVRGRGEPIKTFGGVASGPKPLHDMIDCVTRILLPEGVSLTFELDIEDDESKIYEAKASFIGEGEPYKITSSKIVDVFNYIGKCVVSGGVRRTAEIMFGEPDDEEFLNLKQDQAALNDRRWASNNSVFAQIGMDYSAIVEKVATNGEPGICWLDNARQFSRMKDPADNKDRRVAGTNPCGEQSLESYELCNLVETYPAHHDNSEDFQKTLKMAYLYAKTVTLVPTHDPRANAVMLRNRRIGCSMSGITQAMEKFGRREFFNWCDSGYSYIRELDQIYSDWLGIPLSVKTTTVKPSGTVSLLCGATPGIHYPHSEYYIRHVRVANTSPLVQAARDANFDVHPDTYADDTSVIAFPVKEKLFTKGKEDVTVWEQFANAVDMQRHWADNQVSVTVTFTEAEKRDLVTCLETYEDQMKGVSMLPAKNYEDTYDYPPYQTATKEEYLAMVHKCGEIYMGSTKHEVDEKFCSNDTCELPFNKD